MYYIAKTQVYNMWYRFRRDVSLWMGVWKEIIKKKTMREKNVK